MSRYPMRRCSPCNCRPITASPSTSLSLGIADGRAYRFDAARKTLA
jgi:hypothetical protein